MPTQIWRHPRTNRAWKRTQSPFRGQVVKRGQPFSAISHLPASCPLSSALHHPSFNCPLCSATLLGPRACRPTAAARSGTGRRGEIREWVERVRKRVKMRRRRRRSTSCSAASPGTTCIRRMMCLPAAAPRRGCESNRRFMRPPRTLQNLAQRTCSGAIAAPVLNSTQQFSPRHLGCFRLLTAVPKQVDGHHCSSAGAPHEARRSHGRSG